MREDSNKRTIINVIVRYNDFTIYGINLTMLFVEYQHIKICNVQVIDSASLKCSPPTLFEKTIKGPEWYLQHCTDRLFLLDQSLPLHFHPHCLENHRGGVFPKYIKLYSKNRSKYICTMLRVCHFVVDLDSSPTTVS